MSKVLRSLAHCREFVKPREMSPEFARLGPGWTTALWCRLPAPGTVRTRQYGNRPIVVTVLADGFEYEPRRYRSLSAIAREVTGTRWNALLFLGPAERRHA